VEYIVRGEIVYLILQVVVIVLSAVSGTGPPLENWLFALVSAGLLALFVATYVSRLR
jgi:hypothetical protein